MRPEVAQESHMPVAAICVTVVADLVGSGALEDVIRVVGVAELALILPNVTGADETMAHGDVHQQIGLSNADAEIGRLPSCNHLIRNLQHDLRACWAFLKTFYTLARPGPRAAQDEAPVCGSPLAGARSARGVRQGRTGGPGHSPPRRGTAGAQDGRSGTGGRAPAGGGRYPAEAGG